MSKLQDVAAGAADTEATDGGADQPVRFLTGRPSWRLLGRTGRPPAIDGPAEADDELTSRFSDGLPFTMSLD